MSARGSYSSLGDEEAPSSLAFFPSAGSLASPDTSPSRQSSSSSERKKKKKREEDTLSKMVREELVKTETRTTEERQCNTCRYNTVRPLEFQKRNRRTQPLVRQNEFSFLKPGRQILKRVRQIITDHTETSLVHQHLEPQTTPTFLIQEKTISFHCPSTMFDWGFYEPTSFVNLDPPLLPPPFHHLWSLPTNYWFRAESGHTMAGSVLPDKEGRLFSVRSCSSWSKTGVRRSVSPQADCERRK